MTIERDEAASGAEAARAAESVSERTAGAEPSAGDGGPTFDAAANRAGGLAFEGDTQTELVDLRDHDSPAGDGVVESSTAASGLTARTDGRARPLAAIGTVVAGLVVVAAVIALGPLGLIGHGASSTPAASSPSAAPTFAFAERSVGIASAPVTIEVWADFQCPFCGLFTHGVEPSLMREEAATGKALVTYHDFAFLGQESTDAAVAARCAGAQGQFWRYHDLLFASQRGENQGAFSRDVLLGLARFAKLDPTAFASCLDDPAMAAAVRSDTATGRSLGVSSTPTVRIVGPKGTDVITGITDPSTIEAAVDRGGAPAPSPASSGSGAPSITAEPSGATTPAPSPSAAP